MLKNYNDYNNMFYEMLLDSNNYYKFFTFLETT